MSNIFHHTGITYFQVPEGIFTAGIIFRLRPASLQMYLALLYWAQRRSRPNLTVTNGEFATLAGISPNSVRTGRTELGERGLVQYTRGRGGAYTYTLSILKVRSHFRKIKPTVIPIANLKSGPRRKLPHQGLAAVPSVSAATLRLC